MGEWLNLMLMQTGSLSIPLVVLVAAGGFYPPELMRGTCSASRLTGLITQSYQPVHRECLHQPMEIPSPGTPVVKQDDEKVTRIREKIRLVFKSPGTRDDVTISKKIYHHS